MKCAKELEEAGVRFRARVKAKTFLDVSFHGGGVLEIPPLQLYDSSEALFRNLIAFEQTYLDTPGHVTSYAIFMDCLIKTPEDMIPAGTQLLQQSLGDHIARRRRLLAPHELFQATCN
jgi:hypothetical protein